MFFIFLLLIYFILVSGAYVFWRRKLPAFFHLFFWPALLATMLLSIFYWASVEDYKRHNTPQAIFESEFHQQPTGKIYTGEWSPSADSLFISLDFQCSPEELRPLLAKMRMHPLNVDEFRSQADPADAKVSYTPKDQFYFNDTPATSHGRVYHSEKRSIIYDPTQQLAQYRFTGID